ncbi:MAG: hypothetical protein GXY33_22555 [Phycisphaerae bacterium]|nr:hypothetical protein [Phycisphaerae bacterium]
MDYIFIFHANLHYSQLPLDKKEFVIRESYDATLRLLRERYPQAHFAFEASGYTIEEMQRLAPDVLDRYRQAFADGVCEFMGSPYAHSMLANFPFEDGLWSLKFSMETYEKVLGFRPATAWNPECSWNARMPEMFEKAGFTNLITDWESFLISTRPEVRAVEYDPDRSRKDGKNLPYYDVSPDDPTLHYPLRITDKLTGLMRSDRTCNELLWYMMGQSEETDGKGPAEVPLEKPLSAVRKWTGSDKGGFLIPYAEDAEYCGTTGYFFLKYYNQFRLFEPSPESLQRLDALLAEVTKMGDLITVSEAVAKYPRIEDVEMAYEDKMAWHRTFSDAWANTPWAKELDPHCKRIHDELMRLEKSAKSKKQKDLLKQGWYHLICAENSDGRWPPPPLEPGKWNIDYCWDHVREADKVLEQLKSQ